MARVPLEQRIKKGLLILDGAMGTQLFEKGVQAGQCNEYFNITSRQVIFDIHWSYINAGSDAILTNTFGANEISLARHGLSEMAEKINNAGAKIARQAAGEDKYVLGDIGPTGDFLEPLGNIKKLQLKDAYYKQTEALLNSGVDGFIVETMSALDEMTVAIESIKASTDLPVIASFAYDSAGGDFRTMMGVGVQAAVQQIASLKVAALGFNCGTIAMSDYYLLAEKYKKELHDANCDIPIIAEPNAGLPELVEGQAKYKVSADEFAKEAQKIHKSGATIIGGCCGTSPAHIAAIARELK